MTEFGLDDEEALGLAMDAHTAASVGDLDALMGVEFDDGANAEGWTALHYAAHYDHAEVARWMLRRGAKARGNLTRREVGRRSPLMLCCACGNERTARMLLREAGIEVLEEKDDRGKKCVLAIFSRNKTAKC